MLFSCKKEDEWVLINGEKLKKSIVDTGYYFNKASFSEAYVLDVINNMQKAEKPKNLGTVTFAKNIEEIKLTITNPTEVKDTDIEAKIENIRDEFREEKIVTTKRNVINTDIVVMNYTGKIDGVEFEGGSAVDKQVELGNDSLLPDFEKGIIGKKAGNNFTIYVNFPEDYKDPLLRGKRASYTCLIKYIIERVTPEFDNDFAKKHSKAGAITSNEYRKEIAAEIKFRKEYDTKESLRNQLYEELYKIAKVEPTEDALAWQFTKTVSEQKRLAKLKNISYVEQMTNDYYYIGDMLYTYKIQSEQTIIEPMILDELAKKYHIVYEDGDEEKWFADMAIYEEFKEDVTYDLYREAMGDDYIHDKAWKTKVLDEALKHASIKYLDPIEES